MLHRVGPHRSAHRQTYGQTDRRTAIIIRACSREDAGIGSEWIWLGRPIKHGVVSTGASPRLKAININRT